MYDCTAVEEILEYFGLVYQLRRWSQELMGYEYAFIHQPAKTMKDVDALSRRFSRNLTAYLVQAVQLRHRDIVERSEAYSFVYFTITPRTQKVLPKAASIPPSIDSPFFDSLVLSFRPVTNLSWKSTSTSTITYPTYYTFPLRYIPTTSIPLNNQSPWSKPDSHYNTHLPRVWLSLGAIVSPVGHTIATWPGNILNHHMLESTDTFASLANFFPWCSCVFMQYDTAPISSSGCDWRLYQQEFLRDNIFLWGYEINSVCNILWWHATIFICTILWWHAIPFV